MENQEMKNEMVTFQKSGHYCSQYSVLRYYLLYYSNYCTYR